MEQASYTKQVVNNEPASRSVALARAVHDSVSTLPPYSSVDDIRNDLVHDIKKADKTDFDNIAKYFLFQCLSDNKAGKLGQLQTVIESLQEGDNEDVDIKAQEVGRVLDSLYDESLKAVLAIANHQEIRNPLKNYFDSLKNKDEKQRCAPYAELCNELLIHLAGLGTLDGWLREPSELNLRYMLCDSTEFSSQHQGILYDVRRKPGVVGSSDTSLGDEEYNFESAHLMLPHVLSNKESRVQFTDPSAAAENVAHQGFKFKSTDRQTTITHVDPPKYDSPCHPVPAWDQPSSVPESANISVVSRSSKLSCDVGRAGADACALGAKVPKTISNSRVKVGEAKAPSLNHSSMQADNVDGVESGVPTAKTLRVDSNYQGKAATESCSSIDMASSSPHQPPPKIEIPWKSVITGQTQCAAYALEMLSNNVGVHHVINLLLIDEYLWIWYYDRQGIIQSDGISLVADFPRVLVLLLAFQRFTLEDWGIIPCMNPDPPTQLGLIEPKLNGSQKTPATARKDAHPAKKIILNIQNLEDVYSNSALRKLKSIEIDTTTYLSHKSLCIAGRATAVFKAVGKCKPDDVPMAVKVSHAEVDRYHEGRTIKLLRMLAEERNKKMLNHLPMLHFYADVPNTSTKLIRSVLGLCTKGHRVMRLIGQNLLEKLTTLAGEEFVHAWLEGVIIHSFIWENGVEHGDPSLNNLMYDSEKKCGVLMDYDLAILRWKPRIPGSDRTGTIPFMALDLLSKDYWDGQITRRHHHELESFIWILPYVFLLYDGGRRYSNEHVDGWVTSSYKRCRQLKADFCIFLPKPSGVQPDFELQWPLAVDLCRGLIREYVNRGGQQQPNKNAAKMWSFFVTKLERSVLLRGDQKACMLINELKANKPTFSDLTRVQKKKLDNYHTQVMTEHLRTQ